MHKIGSLSTLLLWFQKIFKLLYISLESATNVWTVKVKNTAEYDSHYENLVLSTKQIQHMQVKVVLLLQVGSY
jgi:hypothetical protein